MARVNKGSHIYSELSCINCIYLYLTGTEHHCYIATHCLSHLAEGTL